MILYFSGTGNSKYCAKNISNEYIKQRKKLDRNLILEMVDRIEIHEDKSLDLYLKIKPLEHLKEM